MTIRRIAKCGACIRRLFACLSVRIQRVLQIGNEAVNLVEYLPRLGLLLALLAMTLLTRASKKLFSPFRGYYIFPFSKQASDRKERIILAKLKKQRRYLTVSEYYRDFLAFPVQPVENGSSGMQSGAGGSGEQPQAGTSGEQPQAGTSGEQPQAGTSGEQPQAWRSAMISFLMRIRRLQNRREARAAVEQAQARAAIELAQARAAVERAHAHAERECSEAVAGSSGAQAQVPRVERIDEDDSSSSGSDGHARVAGLEERIEADDPCSSGSDGDARAAGLEEAMSEEDESSDGSWEQHFPSNVDLFMEFLLDWREEEISRTLSPSEAAPSDRMDEDDSSGNNNEDDSSGNNNEAESSDYANRVINESTLIQLEEELAEMALLRFHRELDFNKERSEEIIFFLLRAIREVHIRIKSGSPIGYSLSIIPQLNDCLVRYSEVFPEVSRFFTDCLVEDNLIPLITADRPARLVPLTEQEVRLLRAELLSPTARARPARLVRMPIPRPSVPPPASGSVPTDRPSTSQRTAEEDQSLEDPEEAPSTSSSSSEKHLTPAGSLKRRLPRLRVEEQVKKPRDVTGARTGSEGDIESSQHGQGQVSLEKETTVSASQKSSEERTGATELELQGSPVQFADTASAQPVAVEAVTEDVPLPSTSFSEEDVSDIGSFKRRSHLPVEQQVKKHGYREQHASSGTESATHVDIAGSEHDQGQVSPERNIPGSPEEVMETAEVSLQHMTLEDDGKDSDVSDSRSRSGMDVAELPEQPGQVPPSQEAPSSGPEESRSGMDEGSQQEPEQASPE